MRAPSLRAALAIGSYLAVALIQTWPLALHLETHLTGLPGGDAGVYVWNTWVFRHELIEAGRFPFATSTVLPLDGVTNLGLHNYTVFANLLSLPLQPWLGVIAAFNVVYIVNVALCGLGVFVLAKRLTGRVAESWIAGAMFAWMPFLVARGGSHFSLAAAAPLAFFVYWLDRAWRSGRQVDALATGAMVAWAASCDPYYGVYTLVLGVIYAADQIVVIVRRRTEPEGGRGLRALDAAIAAAALVVLWVHFLSGGSVRIAPLGVTIAIRSLYTPALLLTVLLAVRGLLHFRPRVSWRPMPRSHARMGAIVAVTAAVVLAPELYAIGLLATEGGVSHAPVPWRSSAPGADLIAFLLPNPNHPLAPAAMVEWLRGQPGQFDENVMSLSWVGLGAVVAAWRLTGYRPGRLWTWITIGSLSLAVGPFLSVAGVRTYMPTPWSLLRYVPILGEARMPQRFGVLVALGFVVIVAGALVALGERFPARRRALLLGVGAAAALELLPAPRQLHAATVPSVYRLIAADPRPIRVLELPFGIRDGLSSLGDFNAASQFYQTTHGKVLLGGYLSRVEGRTKEFYLGQPLPRALFDLSDGREPSAEELGAAKASAPSFVRDTQLGYVVIDVDRTTPALREFAREALGLTAVAADGAMVLYRTDSDK